MSISGTNTACRHLRHSLVRASSMIVAAMLHVNHPLLQFADITDPLLNTAALFSRFIVIGFRPELLRRPHILEDEF